MRACRVWSLFSPQAWGCTASLVNTQSDIDVFPTGVGVYREKPCPCEEPLLFSPQAWGCTEGIRYINVSDEVFPTGVGVYRGCIVVARNMRRFPHRRGGVPEICLRCGCGTKFSPQAWGCTAWFSAKDDSYCVFPTGVGVYRPARWRGESSGYVFPTGVGVYRCRHRRR